MGTAESGVLTPWSMVPDIVRAEESPSSAGLHGPHGCGHSRAPRCASALPLTRSLSVLPRSSAEEHDARAALSTAP